MKFYPCSLGILIYAGSAFTHRCHIYTLTDHYGKSYSPHNNSIPISEMNEYNRGMYSNHDW